MSLLFYDSFFLPFETKEFITLVLITPQQHKIYKTLCKQPLHNISFSISWMWNTCRNFGENALSNVTM